LDVDLTEHAEALILELGPYSFDRLGERTRCRAAQGVAGCEYRHPPSWSGGAEAHVREQAVEPARQRRRPVAEYALRLLPPNDCHPTPLNAAAHLHRRDLLGGLIHEYEAA
jgi:hypothetical protein